MQQLINMAIKTIFLLLTLNLFYSQIIWGASSYSANKRTGNLCAQNPDMIQKILTDLYTDYLCQQSPHLSNCSVLKGLNTHSTAGHIAALASLSAIQFRAHLKIPNAPLCPLPSPSSVKINPLFLIINRSYAAKINCTSVKFQVQTAVEDYIEKSLQDLEEYKQSIRKKYRQITKALSLSYNEQLQQLINDLEKEINQKLGSGHYQESDTLVKEFRNLKRMAPDVGEIYTHPNLIRDQAFLNSWDEAKRLHPEAFRKAQLTLEDQIRKKITQLEKSSNKADRDLAQLLSKTDSDRLFRTISSEIGQVNDLIGEYKKAQVQLKSTSVRHATSSEPIEDIFNNLTKRNFAHSRSLNSGTVTDLIANAKFQANSKAKLTEQQHQRQLKTLYKASLKGGKRLLMSLLPAGFAASAMANPQETVNDFFSLVTDGAREACANGLNQWVEYNERCEPNLSSESLLAPFLNLSFQQQLELVFSNNDICQWIINTNKKRKADQWVGQCDYESRQMELQSSVNQEKYTLHFNKQGQLSTVRKTGQLNSPSYQMEFTDDGELQNIKTKPQTRQQKRRLRIPNGTSESEIFNNPHYHITQTWTQLERQKEISAELESSLQDYLQLQPVLAELSYCYKTRPTPSMCERYSALQCGFHYSSSTNQYNTRESKGDQ